MATHDRTGHAPTQSLNAVALSATLHCLTGCAIGEVLGMIIGTALGWSNWGTIALAVALAFLFGYSLTSLPLLRAGAMEAGLDELGFYAALTAALIIAGAFAYPANRWLISRGKGHAVVHQ